MGRPRIYEEARVATAIRLPESMYRELHDAAAERDVSVNLIVTRAVSHYLSHLVPAPHADELDCGSEAPEAAKKTTRRIVGAAGRDERAAS